MRVVHLARKPISEGSVAGNVLKHGTGALNVNGSRISAPGEAVSTHTRSPEASKKENRPIYGEYGPLTTHQTVGQTLGRWPANVLLQHLPSCRCTGTRTVRSDGHYPAARPPGSQVSGPSGHAGQDQLPEAYTDGEAVETWACVEGCPVPDLDKSSGTSRSSGGRIGNKDGGHIYGGGKGLTGAFEAGDPGYGDTGGASRFYKQVGGSRSCE